MTVRALQVIPKKLEKRLSEFEIYGRIKIVQPPALLKSARRLKI